MKKSIKIVLSAILLSLLIIILLLPQLFPDNNINDLNPLNHNSDSPSSNITVHELGFNTSQYGTLILFSPSPVNHSMLYGVTKEGLMLAIANFNTTSSVKIALNISSRLELQGEQGFIGLTFDPHFATNRYIYTTYSLRTNRHTFHCNPCSDTMISRWTMNLDHTVNVSSEFHLLSIPQLSIYHKSGELKFGHDGMLYIGVGDSSTHGQDRSTLYGSILRIDPSKPSAGLNYTIPVDNPYYNNTSGYRPEIWAYGLRNPWTFTPDTSDNLWVGDVGSNNFEEINIVRKGLNYGWNITEGYDCVRNFKIIDTCNTTGITFPLYAYGHNATSSDNIPSGRAIMGGFAYQGSNYPQLHGYYFFGDASGKFWKMKYNVTDGQIEVVNISHIITIGWGMSNIDLVNDQYIVFGSYYAPPSYISLSDLI